MLYLYAAAAIAFAAVIGYATIQHSQKLEAQAELGACNTKIEAQNAAIAATKADGDRRVAEATEGAKAAAKATAPARNEAERLRVVTRTVMKPGACPAAEGVAEVRKGLSK